jgi:Heterokaryon incompatibility protein (HET)
MLLSEELICNGARYPITSNLQQALRCAHSTLGPKWLWIDAICISQTNTVEKSQQVAQIYRLFSSAVRVIVWLGSATAQSDIAMDMIHSICTGESSDSSGLDHPNAAVLMEIFSRPWFRRL